MAITRRRFLAVSGAGAAVFAGGFPAVARAATSIKIGLLGSYSGPYASLAEHMTNGFSLFLEQNGWSVGGRKIELLKEDDEAKPAVGLRKARKLVEQNKVDLLAGVIPSNLAYAVKEYAVKSQVPFICTVASATGLTKKDVLSPYYFRTSQSGWQVSSPMGIWVAQNVSKKVFLAANDYAFGKEAQAAFKQSFEKAGGTVLGEVYAPLGTTDYAPYITQIGQRSPEAVYAVFAGTDATRFVTQYDSLGLKKSVPLTGFGYVTAEDVLPAQGKAALGIKTSLQWTTELDHKENREFMAAYEKRYGVGANIDAVSGYDAAHFIHAGLKTVEGDISDKQRFAKAVEAVAFTGPRGPVSIDKETHNVIQNMYIREVREKSGKLVNALLYTFEKVRDPGI